MAPHSSTLAWKIPWTGEPGGLQSMGSQRVGHDERLHFHFSLACIGERNGNPLQCSCVENPRDRRAWWAAVYGVAQSRIRLKRLSSSRSLLNISYIFSILVSSLFICNFILFSRFWIIFTVIILNSFSGRLPISSSFVWFGGHLLCSFSC